MDEILTTARDLELEVNEDDIKELIMERVFLWASGLQNSPQSHIMTSLILGMAKVVVSNLLSGMTAIGRTMESGRRGYGASSGRKS
ncbi:hypothetical protein TNCV_2852891 [Trichonephila clavipes]|uniref:Uncharacterized protein n=1 Tax=Trichonephila clavipes TaxID=2585209 RepID=A0A8X6RBA6_TRICX|nr:hypothetical protein TNCV_2852891 [Trichonephila clavipes]